ncbi:MAG: hypothetical protein ABIK10_00515 [candidate division WOR-3 bacterium]
MKRIILVFLALLIFTSGCYTVKLVAPPDQEMRLLPETEATTVKIQKRAIFLLYGLIPISNASTDEILKNYTDLKGIKAKTEFDIIDYVISALTSGLVVTKSIVIEGTTGK